MRLLVFRVVVIALFIIGAWSCKKASHSPHNGGSSDATTDSVYNPVDPSPSATIGFFGNSWAARTFSAPADSTITVASSLAVTDSLVIDVNRVLVKTPPLIFGNNTIPFIGQIITQPSLMQYIRDLSPNIIRGPGGSISDVYFWNGNPANPAPADAPDSIYTYGKIGPINAWSGQNTQSWSLSIANYYNVLAQTNSTAILTINYGYARYGTGTSPVDSAAHLAANWVRYDAGRTKYWEIGNECYGNWEPGYQIDSTKNHDGQPTVITGALYGQHFNVFADSMRAAARETGATIYIGAVLEATQFLMADIAADQIWNAGVLSKAGNTADFYIVHDYFTAYNTNSTVPQILVTGITEVPTDMAFYRQQLQANGAAIKPIAMTEWNIEASGSKQNTSYIAGMHAALTLGSFIRYQFGEASRWDLANAYAGGNDLGMFNVGDEPNAPLWNPRPAFYYMYYFQKCFGDRMVYDTLRQINSDLTAYASTFSSGQAGAVIINTGPGNHVLSIDFQHFPAGSKYHWYVLTGGTDNAPFSGQVYVNGIGPATPTGGPLNYPTIKPYGATLKGTIRMSIPAMSVVYLVADGNK